MHEVSIVSAMIESLQEQLAKQNVTKVTALRLRRGSTFAEAALRQSFEALSAGTLCEGAELVVETVNRRFACGCGYTQTITSDDLVGHMFVCPGCGTVQEIDEAHDLELLDVVAETADAAQSA